jgi:hypothetical protein
MEKRRKGSRVAGHRLEILRSTERSLAERAHTGQCSCGWEESCATIKEVRREYSAHLSTKRKERR